MKVLVLVLLVWPLCACQTQGRFEKAGRSVDDAVSDVREGAEDVIEDVSDAAKDVGDDVRRSRR
jgi:hypothetical protein